VNLRLTKPYKLYIIIINSRINIIILIILLLLILSIYAEFQK
jgi:hypothetical protein